MRTVLNRILPFLLLLAAGCGDKATPAGGTGSWLPLKYLNQWEYRVTEADGTARIKVQGVIAEVAVGGTGPHKDTLAFRLETGSRFPDQNADVSFQGLVGTRLVRYAERSIGASSGSLKNETFWDPPKLRVDDAPEHITMGAEWPESYTEHVLDTEKPDASAAVDADPPDAGAPVDAAIVDMTKQVSDLWSVVAVSDPVTVPAGKFNAMKLKRISQDGVAAPTIKYFWFVRGVGKVKEAGELGSTEQTEELVSYTVNP